MQQYAGLYFFLIISIVPVGEGKLPLYCVRHTEYSGQNYLIIISKSCLLTTENEDQGSDHSVILLVKMSRQ